MNIRFLKIQGRIFLIKIWVMVVDMVLNHGKTEKEYFKDTIYRILIKGFKDTK